MERVLLPGEEPLTTLEALISATSTEDPAIFKSISKGVRTGNAQPVAYGGYAQALCVNAAAATCPTGFSLYNFAGIYLGPISTTQHVSLTVNDIRRTRTFHTRSVTISQVSPKGEKRDTFTAIVDFIHSAEPESMTYYVSPRIPYTPADACPDYRDHLQARLAEGSLTKQHLAIYYTMFGAFAPIMEQRFCPEGVGYQNLWGVDRKAKTTQDDRHITAKTTAWWVRSRHRFEGHPDGDAMHKAALCFVMDAGTSFIPLTHSGRFFDSTTACSSLDVSVRFRSSRFRLDEWMLLELYTEAGGEGRTMPVMKAWTETGELVASASQNCIMRFRPDVPRVKL
ncbi:Hypothetical protein D9617_21g097160 [Elsinoe fawcettii]|nr:Hypothetical protein D9617_21g097160 [Elsinoe fawcettii]